MPGKRIRYPNVGIDFSKSVSLFEEIYVIACNDGAKFWI